MLPAIGREAQGLLLQVCLIIRSHRLECFDGERKSILSRVLLARKIPALPAGTFFQKPPTQALRPGSGFIPTAPIAHLTYRVHQATISNQKTRREPIAGALPIVSVSGYAGIPP